VLVGATQQVAQQAVNEVLRGTGQGRLDAGEVGHASIPRRGAGARSLPAKQSEIQIKGMGCLSPKSESNL